WDRWTAETWEMKPPAWLFLHPPRTGGSSILEQIGLGPLNRDHLPSAAYATIPSLRAPSPRPPIMGIVRNPYDRAVSLCAYCAYSLDYTRELGQWGPLSVKAFELWVKHGCLCRYVCNPDLPFSRNVAEPQVHWFVPSQVDRLLWFEDLPGARREVERVTGCQTR
ncbi:MAG: hypothetical protein ACYTEX_25570, partial [Planctomycetota bacterium]